VVEVYPRLWNRAPKPDGWTDDQYDAFVVAGQLQRADRNGRLAEWLKPSLPAEDLARASTEGWILGVDPKPLDDRKRSVRRPSRPAAGPDAARTSLIRPVVVRRVVSAGGDRARLGDVSAAMGTACAPCGTKALGTGLITVTLERPPALVVVRNVPARICSACGEKYLDEATSSRLLELFAEAIDAGGMDVQVRNF
jgi:YgiT-type zinc finger domain-containing protein